MKKNAAILAVVMLSGVLGLARIAPIVGVSIDVNTPKSPLSSGAVGASLLRLDVFANADVQVNTFTFRVDVTGKVAVVNLRLFGDGVQLGNIVANVVPGKSNTFTADFMVHPNTTRILEIRGDVAGTGAIKVTLTRASGVEVGNLAAISFPGHPVQGNSIQVRRLAR